MSSIKCNCQSFLQCGLLLLPPGAPLLPPPAENKEPIEYNTLYSIGIVYVSKQKRKSSTNLTLHLTFEALNFSRGQYNVLGLLFKGKGNVLYTIHIVFYQIQSHGLRSPSRSSGGTNMKSLGSVRFSLSLIHI